MSQSIQKALRILEVLARQTQQPKMLAEISKELNMTIPTCARILDTLIKEGYVEKYGQRRGYILGSKAYALTVDGPYMKSVTDIALPEVQRCAEEIKQYVLLCAFRQGRCYPLIQISGNEEIQIRSNVYYNSELCTMAVGRLFLAYADENEINAYIKLNGLPGKRWPECSSQKSFFAQLKKIQADRCAIIIEETWSKFACPIQYNQSKILGLSCLLPTSDFLGKNHEKISKCLLNTAAEIETRLCEITKND